MALQLEPNRGRYWFMAAAIVTGRGGIKSMEGKWRQAALAVYGKAVDGIEKVATGHVETPSMTKSDARLVLKGNQFLFSYNLHTYSCLSRKQEIPGFEGFWGPELDRALVVLEQTAVQAFLDAESWGSPDERRLSLRRISGGFSFFLASDYVKESLKTEFGDPKHFDFGDLDQRIRLGGRIVADMRKSW